MNDRYGSRRTLLTAPPRLRHGWAINIAPASPAAGAGFAHSCPNDAWERVLALNYTLTTNAVVANRSVKVNWLDGDGLLAASALGPGPAVVASTVVTGSHWLGQVNGRANSGTSSAPIPDLIMRPGWSFQIAVAAMDPGDTLTGITFLLERYPANVASGAEEEEEYVMLREVWDSMTGRRALAY